MDFPTDPKLTGTEHWTGKDMTGTDYPWMTTINCKIRKIFTFALCNIIILHVISQVTCRVATCVATLHVTSLIT